MSLKNTCVPWLRLEIISKLNFLEYFSSAWRHYEKSVESKEIPKTEYESADLQEEAIGFFSVTDP